MKRGSAASLRISSGRGHECSLIGGERQTVRIFFDAKVARYVRRRRWHPTQRIVTVPGGVELTMEVAGSVEVASWVLGFGDKAVVLEPTALRDRVAGELRTAAARY
jgi:predicted DNA-binding transcriptional regulator YafY